MEIKQAKKEIIKYAKKMYTNDMINIFEGNISMRLEDRFIITPSQQSKEDMTEDMIVEMDGDGNVLNPSELYKPSSERKMHLEVFRLRPDVNAVVHNHSAYATAYAVAGKPIRTHALTEMILVFGEIPVVPYGRPGTDKIFAGFAEYLKYRNAVLLANHGVLTVGGSMLKAFGLAEAVEKLAQTLLYAKLLGGEQPIPSDEEEEIRDLGDKRRRTAIDDARTKILGLL
jgi:L-fuculose-phosphate aldolase